MRSRRQPIPFWHGFEPRLLRFAAAFVPEKATRSGIYYGAKEKGGKIPSTLRRPRQVIQYNSSAQSRQLSRRESLLELMEQTRKLCLRQHNRPEKPGLIQISLRASFLVRRSTRYRRLGVCRSCLCREANRSCVSQLAVRNLVYHRCRNLMAP